MIDINHIQVSSGHQREHLLRQTAQQHGITLTGVLQSCGGCLEVKGIRAGTVRRTTSRAGKPVDTVHIDLSGPYEASLGGSVYLITFVDSASRWMRPYGMRRKSETTAYVQKFIADTNGMGKPNCFRTDNGAEFISRDYVDCCDSAGIRREYTAPGKPQQNAVVESVIWRAMKGGHAARLEIGRLGFRLFQPIRDQGEHRTVVTARGFLQATAGPAGDSFFPFRHDAGGPEHQVRCRSG